MTFFIVVLVVFLWINLGLAYAELKLRVYEKYEDDVAPAWLVFFFWPVFTLNGYENIVGLPVHDLHPVIYKGMMVVFWPISLLWQIMWFVIFFFIFLFLFLVVVVAFTLAQPLKRVKVVRMTPPSPIEFLKELYQKLVK